MVIKENSGKVVILLDNRDILDYVFEKCGFEVGITVENMVNRQDDTEDDEDDTDLEVENEQLRWELEQSQQENEQLRRKLEDAEENCKMWEKKFKKGGKNESTGPKI